MANKGRDLSGISVALAFVTAGLLLLYAWPDTYGRATLWLGAGVVLVGVGGFMIELSKLPSTKKYRFSDLGVGIVLLAPTVFAAQTLYASGWPNWLKTLVMTSLILLILFGVYGIVNFVMSILEGADGLQRKLADGLKFLAAVITAAAALLAAIKQLLG